MVSSTLRAVMTPPAIAMTSERESAWDRVVRRNDELDALTSDQRAGLVGALVMSVDEATWRRLVEHAAAPTRIHHPSCPKRHNHLADCIGCGR